MTCKYCEDRRKGLVEAISKKDAIKAAQIAMEATAVFLGVKKKPEDNDRI